MTITFQTFKDRIVRDLLPEFCDDPSRGWGCGGFREDWKNVTETDAVDFLRALDAGLIEHHGRGRYQTPRSKGLEQFFWSGKKGGLPRPVTLWVEPIITVAALSRLHFKWGWPKELIGTQSRKSEFDLTAYQTSDFTNEYLAGEVKKTIAELEQLVKFMQRFSVDCIAGEAAKSAKEVNAFRKLKGLQARRASIFWAVGPGGANKLFRVSYTDEGAVIFKSASEDALRYAGG